jgi:UDP-N-acetylmuramoyl-tripeptide--D-alanyl-D-alanine ligase
VNLKKVVEIANGKVIDNIDLEKDYNEFKVDSREIEKGDIFVAFKGENVDGHEYIENAFENDAIAAIIDNEAYFKKYDNGLVILVPDVLKTIQKLASYIRNEYNPIVIGITGSNGKTSVKNFVMSVLKKKYNVIGNNKNLNNHIGLPLTLLRLKKEHEVIVLEMGMNHLGEIELLSNIARPNISIIVNVGTSHIGNLGSMENILKAKMEIMSGMTEDGILITNADDEYLEKIKTHLKHYKVGTKGDLSLISLKREDEFYIYNVKYQDKEYIFKLKTLGEHFVTNSLFGIMVGIILDVDMNDIIEAISNTELEKRRMEINNLSRITLIDDAYNAITSSMIMAIKSLRHFNKNKVLILADMLELGEFSKQEHEKVGDFINNEKIDLLITIGKDAKYIYDKVNCNKHHFSNNEEAINYLKNNKIKDDSVVLVKGSNGMNLKEICDFIKNNY